MASGILIKRLVLSVLLIGVLVGIYLSGRWMLADLVLEDVRYSFKQWDDAGAVPSLQNWLTERDRLDRAGNLDPRNAEIYRLQGLLWEWRLYTTDSPLNQTQQIQARQEAITHYRESARLRPAWPDAWAHIARQKALMTMPDDEFDLALSRADTLGQWEARIHLLIAETGTLVWNRLNTDQQNLVVDAIARGLSRQPESNQLLNQFRSLNTLDFLHDTICPQLDPSGLTYQARQACQ